MILPCSFVILRHAGLGRKNVVSRALRPSWLAGMSVVEMKPITMMCVCVCFAGVSSEIKSFGDNTTMASLAVW